MSPCTTGRFTSSGACTKCSSMSRIPSRTSCKASRPNTSATATATDDDTEYRPPTLSGMVSTHPAVIPVAATRSGCAVTTMKWSATFCTPWAVNHSVARRAFDNVSLVPNDFEHTTNNVCSPRKPVSARSKSSGSMLDAKRTSRCIGRMAASASQTNAGPRSLPPMPMLTT